MTGATTVEIRSFLQSMGLQCAAREVSFPDSSHNAIRVDFRIQEPHQLLYLARLLAHLTYDEVHFRGATLWVTAFEIWNPLEEAITLKLFEQCRRSYGEIRSLESAPGTYFRHDEFVESVCCLLQPMLIGWDAYYIPTWAYGGLDYFVAVSHDGFASVETRTREAYDSFITLLRSHDWIKPLIK